MPYHLLPDQVKEKKAKIVYIHRDLKDVIVSYYFFARMLTFINYVGTLQEFAWQVLLNKVPYAPYFDHLNDYLTAAENHPEKVRKLKNSYTRRVFSYDWFFKASKGLAYPFAGQGYLYASIYFLTIVAQ